MVVVCYCIGVVGIVGGGVVIRRGCCSCFWSLW